MKQKENVSPAANEARTQTTKTESSFTDKYFCRRPGRARPYEFAGHRFSSQQILDKVVTLTQQTHRLDEEFQDPILLAVINNLHPDVIKTRQQATKIRILSYSKQVELGLPTADMYRGGVLVTAWFEPSRMWRPVTLRPWRTTGKRQRVKQALRAILSPWLPKPTALDKCAVPGCGARGFDLEYHHLSPTFAEIANDCLELVSDQEIDSLFGYSKFGQDGSSLAECIPRNHAATTLLFDKHQNNQWCWLCKFHHRGVLKWH